MQVGCDGVVHVIALSNYAQYAGRIKRTLGVQDILTEAGDANRLRIKVVPRFSSFLAVVVFNLLLFIKEIP